MRKILPFFLLSFLFFFKTSFGQWEIAGGPSMVAPRCLTYIDSVIFLGTSAGVFRSYDDGNNWTHVQAGITSNSIRCMHAFNSIIFVGTNSGNGGSVDDGVFKSLDNGNTWIKCRNERIVNIESIGNKLFVIDSHGIYSSKDSGSTWHDEFTSSGVYMNLLASNSSQLYGCASDSSVFSRFENDTIWTPTTISGLTDLAFQSFFVNDSFMCIGTIGDFFIRTNLSVTWTHPANNGIINSAITNLLIDNNYIFAATSTGLIRSYDGGNSWDTINPVAVSCLLKFKNKLLLGNQNGLYSSTDHGTTWTLLYDTYSMGGVRSMTNKDSVILASSANVIYNSSDEGDNWKRETLNSGNINCLLVIDSLLFAGTVAAGTGILKRNWNDTIWVQVNNGLTSFSINALERFGSTIYAGTNNGLFTSSNLAQNWIDISSTLADKHIYSVLVDGSRIFVGTATGVYTTQNNGSSWSLTPIPVPPGTKVQALAIKDSTILAGTFGYGIYISTDNGMNWTASNSGLTGSNFFVRLISFIGSNIFVGLTSQSNPTIGNLFLSIDKGASWVYSPPIVNGIIYNKVNALAYNGRHLFAVSNSNFVLKKPLAQLPNSCAFTVSAQPYVCTYDSVLLSANSGPGFTYQWLKQGVPISGATSANYYAKQSGQYSCAFGGACVGTSPQFTLFGKAAPQPSISPPYHEICPQGDSALFIVDSPNPSYTYQWKHSSGLIPGATNQNYYAKLFGNYYCIASDSFQCKGISNPVILGFNPYADSLITAAGSTKICQGDSVQLLANNGVGNLHQWKLNGIDLPGETLYYCYAKLAGVYTCLVTFGCLTTSIPIAISYTPFANFSSHPDSVLPFTLHLEDLSEGTSSLSYSWDWGDFSPPGIGQAPSHLYSVTSKYNVCLTVTDSGACSNTYCDSLFASAIYVIPPIITANSSLENSQKEKLNIYPVPFNDQLFIELKNSAFSHIKIYSVLGNLIYQNKMDSKITIGSSEFAKGIYIVELSDGKHFSYRKVFKD